MAETTNPTPRRSIAQSILRPAFCRSCRQRGGTHRYLNCQERVEALRLHQIPPKPLYPTWWRRLFRT